MGLESPKKQQDVVMMVPSYGREGWAWGPRCVGRVAHVAATPRLSTDRGCRAAVCGWCVQVVIVDDDPDAFQFQPGNGIRIKPFTDINDKSDR